MTGAISSRLQPLDRSHDARRRTSGVTCDLLWPGVQTTPICYGSVVRPGQFMHGWVSFWGSAEVAVVMLGLNLPRDVDAPGATRPPWSATLVTVEIPPAGWVMP